MLSRMKFEIEPLVAEILDHLPDSVWSSRTSTFFDPAIGGGQFVREIERRLRANGHSDANIKERVYGCEASRLNVKYALNKYKLVGNYEVCDFLTQDYKSMKFDVIVGNPPYQNPGKSKGEKLWYRFIFKSEGLLKDNGYLSLVTPNSWMSGGVNLSSGKRGVFKDLFKKYQITIATVSGVTESYFKGVGIDISWWQLHKIPVESPTIINTKTESFEINFKDIEFLSPVPEPISISIVTKTLFNNSLKVTAKYFQKTIKKGIQEESKIQKGKFLNEHWLHGDKLNKTVETIFLKNKNSPDLEFKKILIPMGSRYWQPYYDSKGIGVASQGFAIPLKQQDTYKGFLSVYHSKLFKYLNFNLQIQRNGFMKTSLVRQLPDMDMSREWTTDEIYKHFGLTEEEIDYIEANVK